MCWLTNMVEWTPQSGTMYTISWEDSLVAAVNACTSLMAHHLLSWHTATTRYLFLLILVIKGPMQSISTVRKEPQSVSGCRNPPGLRLKPNSFDKNCKESNNLERRGSIQGPNTCRVIWQMSRKFLGVHLLHARLVKVCGVAPRRAGNKNTVCRLFFTTRYRRSRLMTDDAV